MRKASLASRLADAATAADDHAADAENSQRVVDYLQEVMSSCKVDQYQKEISKQRSAYLLRAVGCRLAIWNETKKPEQAEELARLFAALADSSWTDGSIDQKAAQSNKTFWHNQALRAWGECSKSAEERGEIEQAEHCCTKVLELLQDQELNA